MQILATIVKNSDGTYTLTFDNGAVYTFSGTYKIISQKDKNANTTSFTYDNDNQLTTITDSLGRNYTLTYDTTRRIKDITDFAGNKVSLTYFSTNTSTGNQYDLQKITLQNGVATKEISFEYTTGTDFTLAHNMTKLIDAK